MDYLTCHQLCHDYTKLSRELELDKQAMLGAETEQKTRIHPLTIIESNFNDVIMAMYRIACIRVWYSSFSNKYVRCNRISS